MPETRDPSRTAPAVSMKELLAAGAAAAAVSTPPSAPGPLPSPSVSPERPREAA
ncbi:MULTISPECIES: hypothetical protein [unclassified Streptomyces]|uniref:hypothetical protein n=1 Tax=unclassified Streptomyces TaxID=2593676 RepID=UPI001928DA16|nr:MULTISPECIES: hypothetical protein [unclassified Streptomyces]MCW5251530.1 hypothetical protein [Streptomyces sp. SHP 1-2]